MKSASFEYVNRKGQHYFLCETKTKPGKPLVLARLERRGAITLPAPRRRGNFFERRRAATELAGAAAALVVAGAPPGVLEVGAPLEGRPILPVERGAWRRDMARWHYLGDGHLIGESLRYVALVGPTPSPGWAGRRPRGATGHGTSTSAGIGSSRRAGCTGWSTTCAA